MRRGRADVRPSRRVLAQALVRGEGDAVGVDVLAEQRHLQHTLIDEGGDLGEYVAGPPVDLLAAQRGHDAERAGVVAADRDTDTHAA